MSLTLRQLQKMFSAAERGVVLPGTDERYQSELGRLGSFLSGGDRWRRAEVTGAGSLHNICNCVECKKAGRTAPGVRNMVDRWAREHGPSTTVEDLIAAEQAKKDPQGQQGQSQGNSPSNQTQTTGPASDEDEQPPAAPPRPSPAPPPPQPSPEQKALDAAKKAVQAALNAAKSKPGLNSQSALAAAKKKLSMARKAASFNATAERSGVSLVARKQVSRGLGRLQSVPQKLRNQMAELINRLVEQGGTVGETFGPVPVLSAAKLVKRMVVRRPLPNALKEDTVAGRPVVLFLPDISPSCAEQAQIACDLANAAGYSGVNGSDVLVLPHFNGDVDSSAEYIPWFNGKPAATNHLDAGRLFREVCDGRSKFRVRVVVCLGDHDAVDRYGSIAELRSVTRVLWLHNFLPDGKTGRPEPAGRELLPHWSPEAMTKLSMVVGCVDRPRMLRGFDMALKMN